VEADVHVLARGWNNVCSRFGGSKQCSGCAGLLVILPKSRRSAWSQMEDQEGVESAQKPNLIARRRNASRRLRSAALVKPHQAGKAYVSLAMAVAWDSRNTEFKALEGMP
jgi:hypothetical protein